MWILVLLLLVHYSLFVAIFGVLPLLIQFMRVVIIYSYDHYTKYSWIYFLKYKSEVLSTFIKFCHFDEHYFRMKTQSFQACLGESDFQAVTPYIRSTRILQRSSCSHTPKHNGCANKNIETLMRQKKMRWHMPHRFQNNIGHMHLRLLIMWLIDYPHHFLTIALPFKIVGHTPNYNTLKVFGCLFFFFFFC